MLVVVLMTLCLASSGQGAPGDRDLCFGTRGLVTTHIGDDSTNDSGPFALVLQPDGKLVAAGTPFTMTAQRFIPMGFALTRYNPNGSADQTFGKDGVVITDFGEDTSAWALVLQPDGKLVVAGSSNDAFALARYWGEVGGECNCSLDSDGLALLLRGHELDNELG